ncbi:MAG TPA: hypothetical protein VMT09_09450 [Steroidobacteraceae bacterium]|nr:hypothetical protein [Steroidobacteraceae bacterium]
MRSAWWLVALFALAGCVSPPVPSNRPQPAPGSGSETASPAEIDRLEQQIEQGRQLMQYREFAQADALFREVFAAEGFAALPAQSRHDALQRGGVTALQMRDPQRGLALLTRACDMIEGDSLDWAMRVRAANAMDDAHEAVAALGVLAKRWPETLPRLEPYNELDYAMDALDTVGSETDRYTILSALFTVHLSEDHVGASNWWRDLALLRLARRDHSGAMGALSRVTDAYVAIGVEVDRRFDPLRYLIAGWPGVPEVARRAIDAASKRALANPNKVEPMTRLASLLKNSLRYHEALQVSDAVIERQEAAGSGIYTDYDREYVWLLDKRADTLFGLGRWDAAIIQEQAATNLPEQGGVNVSQVINLADMYARAGKPAESLAALQRLEPGSASGYGDMQAQGVRVLAAAQLHDPAAIDEALRFLRQHSDEAPGTLQEALLAAGRDAEGARLLISRLEEPKRRYSALLAVQQYADTVLTPWDQEQERRWHALVSRRDVQASIARVGRVGRYPLERRNY